MMMIDNEFDGCWLNLLNRGSGFALDHVNCPKSDVSSCNENRRHCVVQSLLKDTVSQKWRFIPVSSEYCNRDVGGYHIVTTSGSDSCILALTAIPSISAEGANGISTYQLDLMDVDSTNMYQVWRIVPSVCESIKQDTYFGIPINQKWYDIHLLHVPSFGLDQSTVEIRVSTSSLSKAQASSTAGTVEKDRISSESTESSDSSSVDEADNKAKVEAEADALPTTLPDSSQHMLFQQWRAAVTYAPNEREMFSFFDEELLKSVSIDCKDFRSRMKDVLDEYGFVVIQNVLTEQDLQKLESDFGNDLKAICNHHNIQQLLEASSTSEEANSPSLAALEIAYNRFMNCPIKEAAKNWPGINSEPLLCTSYGLPQGSFAWNARLHPTVREIFRELYSDELHQSNAVTALDTVQEHDDGLVAGMDPVFFKPIHALPAATTREWCHTDFNIHCARGGQGHYMIYQSILSIWPSVDTSNWATVLWPRSHKDTFYTLQLDKATVEKGKAHHNSHFAKPNEMSYELADPRDIEHSPEDIRLAYQRMLYNKHQHQEQQLGPINNFVPIHENFLRQAHRIALQSGSLLIWNTRTIHQGWNEGSRLAMPICWQPRRHREIEEEIEANLTRKELEQENSEASDITKIPTCQQLIYNRKLRIALSGKITTHWASLGVEHSLLMRDRTEVRLHDDPNLIELASGPFMIPYPVRPECASQYSQIIELCQKLKESGDVDEEVASQLKGFIRPEIAVVL